LAVAAHLQVSNSFFEARDGRAMSPSEENKLISLLMEIRSDIRQIESDLKSLLTLLKEQQQKPTPALPSTTDETTNGSASSGSPEDVLRYLRETRGEDNTGE
jgi:hypothetical protein